MKVILREQVSKLGQIGDVKEVSDGYARNFLLPRNLVWEAIPSKMKMLEKEKIKIEKLRQIDVDKAKSLAAQIEALSLTINVKVGEHGKLFGSVTNADIAEELTKKGFATDKHFIVLEEPLKETGVFTVEVKVHPEVNAKAKVWIVAEKTEKEN